MTRRRSGIPTPAPMLTAEVATIEMTSLEEQAPDADRGATTTDDASVRVSGGPTATVAPLPTTTTPAASSTTPPTNDTTTPPREGGGDALTAFLPNAVDATRVEVILSERDEAQLAARKRRLVLGLGGSVCVALALAIIVPLVTLHNPPSVLVMVTEVPSLQPSMAPSGVPTLPPTTESQQTLLDFFIQQSLLLLDDDNDEWWTNASSAPYRAATWIASDDHYQIYGGPAPMDTSLENGSRRNNDSDTTTSQLLQRFALATLYYATAVAPLLEDGNVDGTEDVPEWKHCGPTSPSCPRNSWLSLEEECTWGFVGCDNATQTHVTDLILGMSFNVLCTVSIVSLGCCISDSSLVFDIHPHSGMIDFRGNNLHGSLPPQLSFLSHLQVLTIPNNHIQGGMMMSLGNNGSTSIHAIDRALQGISTLQVLTLFDNDFSGSLPTRLWQTNPDLRMVLLSLNRFDGSIPTEIFSATQLRELQLRGNQLTGSIPTWIGSLGSSLRKFLSFAGW